MPITWRGVRINPGAVPSLLRAEKLSGLPMRPVQGSYSTGVGASAGTHAGGDAIDLSVRDWSEDQIEHAVLWLRRCGWAAWRRGPKSYDGFVPHIHGIRLGSKIASRVALAQLEAYKQRRDGLARNWRDDRNPYVVPITWERCKYNPKNAPVKVTPAVQHPLAQNSFKGFLKVSAIRKGYPSHVAMLQRMLKATGRNPGPFDGIMGPMTKAALNGYRRQRFPQWGRDRWAGAVGIASLKALRADSIKRQPKLHWPQVKEN